MTEGIVDIFQAFVDSQFENVHTIIPGRIVRYDGHDTRRAEVQPLIKLRTRNGDDISIPPIQNVPVVFPSSSGFNLLFPLTRDDGCLILFSEAGIGNYLNSRGQEVEADDVSRFSLTDAICIPGLFPWRNVPKNITTNIEMTSAGLLKLQGGTQSFVKGEALETLLNDFLTACSGITPGTEAQNAVALGVIKTAATTALSGLSGIKSTKIKGE